VRAKAELELEKVDARVRKLRVDNEAKTTPQLASSLTDTVLRYRQIELWREALQRWDGRVVIGDTSVARSIAAPPAAAGSAQPSTPDAEPGAAEPGVAEPVVEGDTATSPEVETP
jgi:hypothetical protein